MPERKVRHTRSDDLQVRVPGGSRALVFGGVAVVAVVTVALWRGAARSPSNAMPDGAVPPSTPSGLPRSARRATPNPCLEVFTTKDAEALSIPSFEITADDDTENKCGVFAIAKRPGAPTEAFRLLVIGTSGPPERPETGDSRETLPGIGEANDDVYLADGSARGDWAIVVRRRGGELQLHLAADVYDHDAAVRIASRLRGRLGIIDTMAERFRLLYGD